MMSVQSFWATHWHGILIIITKIGQSFYNIFFGLNNISLHPAMTSNHIAHPNQTEMMKPIFQRALPSSSEGWLQNKFLIKVRQDDSNWKDGVWPMSATIVPTADGQRTVAFQQPVAQIWIVGHSLQVAWFNCEWCLPRFLKHQQYFLHV